MVNTHHRRATQVDPEWLVVKDMRPRAAAILARYGIARPPVPIFDIARSMGITVRNADNPGWAGALQVGWDPPSAWVWLRKSDSEPRRRFTLAHEIAHLILHVDDHDESTWLYRDETYAGTPQEAQANGYAANLLVPLDWLRRRVLFSMTNESELADMFQVSLAAMRLRLQKLAGSR